MGQHVAVYGAYGHTGRFVVAELLERGFTPVLSGRDDAKLRALAATYAAPLEVRPAPVDDPALLDAALTGAAAVVNCAGPFALTAPALVDAALRTGIPYVDVAAELEANADTFAHFAGPARDAGVAVVPAMAFFGGLGDLLITAAMGDWTTADEAHVAYGLSGWHPTQGTLAAGEVSHERRGGQRVRHANGKLEYHTDEPTVVQWQFPEPLGARDVVAEFTMADVVTVPSHLPIPDVTTYMAVEAAGELSAATSPAPVGERAAETFVVDAVVRSGGSERRASARGSDIYGVTAPLAVEAVARILDGRVKASGVASAGDMFDPIDFLQALSPRITVDLHR